MKELINKSALVTEIEKMRDKAYPQSDWNRGYVTSCEKILSFIDTLEVKEVDLEKEFDKCCENYIFDDECDVYIARRFFELGLNTKKGE